MDSNQDKSKDESKIEEHDSYGPDYIHDEDNNIIPHPVIHDFTSIKWLRNRVNPNTIERSVNRLLPQNGQPIEEKTDDPKEIQARKLKKFLNAHNKGKDNFNNIRIKPKYFFSKLTYQKVLKLKQIFLEFDADGSRKLEINEMEEMFRTNKIDVTMADLLGLFFKDKKIPKNEDPYLDFYRFMEFALSKESDQLYRNFMREIKKKIVNQNDEKRLKKERENKFAQEVAAQNNDLTSYNLKKKEENHSEEENFFLPMNFNLVLDYFNNKGKDRELEKKIKRTINKIDDYMKSDNEKEKSQELKDKVTENSNEEDKNSENSKSFKNVENEENEENTDSDNGEIVISKVLDRYNELLKPKRASDNTSNHLQKILNKRSNVNSKNGLNKITENLPSAKLATNGTLSSKKLNILNRENTFDEKNEGLSTIANETYSNVFPDKKKNYITEYIKNNINKFDIPESMTKNFFNKYKSLILAAEFTKSQLQSKIPSKVVSEQMEKNYELKSHRNFSNQNNLNSDKSNLFKTTMKIGSENTHYNVNLPEIKTKKTNESYKKEFHLNNSKIDSQTNTKFNFYQNTQSNYFSKQIKTNIKKKHTKDESIPKSLLDNIFGKNTYKQPETLETIQNMSIFNSDYTATHFNTGQKSSKASSNRKIKIEF